MDALSDILRGLRTRGSVIFCDYLNPPWTLDFVDEKRAMFHAVRRGRCCLDIDGDRSELAPGDFVFIGPYVDHSICACEGDANQTMLLCGYCEFNGDKDDLLVRHLPRHLSLRQDELAQWPWFVRTLEHLSAEYLSEAPGSELTVDKLTEVLLVQLLRADFGRSSKTGIIHALQDKRLAKALSAMHETPEQDWTLESAATTASMSRSGFARKFREILDISFYDYLTSLRMRNAKEMLSESNLAVSDIGERVGYQSPLAFVKAFKKLNGVTPRAYRRKAES